MGIDNDSDHQATAATDLRRQAEARNCAKAVDQQSPRAEADVQRLVHELEVHQIELEMQNAELLKAQERLELSRNRYAGLYDFAPVGYFTFNAQGIIREVNLTGARLLGTERSLLTGRHFADFIAEAEGRATFSEHLEAVLQKQVMQRCEIRLTGKDATVIHGLLQSVTVDTIKSRDGCILSSIVDGTAGKQLADELQKVHDNLESIVEERTGELTSVNMRLSQEIEERKRTEEELTWNLTVNQALSSLYFPLVSAGTNMELIAAIILEKSRLLTGSAHGYVSEVDPVTGGNIGHTLTRMMPDCQVAEEELRKLTFQRGADGLYNGLWGHALNTREPFYTNAPLRHPASAGIPQGHLAIERFLSVPVVLHGELSGQIALSNSARDYTDRDVHAVMRIAGFYALAIQRKRAEDALYEAQQVFCALVENSPDIIARYDRECRRTYVNPTYLKVARLPRQELLETAPMELSPLPADSAALLQTLLRRVLDSGVAEAIDAVWSMPDNIDHWYNIFAFPEFDRDGRVISVMTISRDITERKQAEETIRLLNEDLEQRVRERTKELERRNRELEQMNKAFVGRELKMVELKERIKELEEKLIYLTQK